MIVFVEWEIVELYKHGIPAHDGWKKTFISVLAERPLSWNQQEMMDINTQNMVYVMIVCGTC